MKWMLLLVPLVSLLMLSSLAEAHWLWDCCPNVEPKQPKKCGEHVHFHGGRNMWQAAPGEFPYLADIEIKLQELGNLANCSGAIVSPTDILTSIKCVRNKSGGLLDKESELKVFVGSLFQGKHGQEVKVENILQFQLESNSNECGLPNVHHGLALLKLAERLDFRFEKREPSSKANKTKKKRIFLNSACFIGAKFDQDLYLNSSQFLSGGDLCAKALEFRLAPCPFGDEIPKIGCATMIKGPDGLAHNNYQEGAPLVELTSENRWQLIGILSKDVDFFGTCEPHDNKDAKLTKFVPLYDQSIQKWLKKEVLNIQHP